MKLKSVLLNKTDVKYEDLFLILDSFVWFPHCFLLPFYFFPQWAPAKRATGPVWTDVLHSWGANAERGMAADAACRWRCAMGDLFPAQW